MRYFRSKSTQAIYPSLTDSSYYETNPQYFEEVLLVSKPQPKTWNVEVAYFRHEFLGCVVSVNRAGLDYALDKGWKQISEWQTVTFVEKIDEANPDKHCNCDCKCKC